MILMRLRIGIMENNVKKHKFRCSECHNERFWLMEGDREGVCAYCCGRYEDGEKCPGGKV